MCIRDSPWDLEAESITFTELYDKMMATENFGESLAKGLRSAYKHCENLYKRKYKSITAYDMQNTIDSYERGYSSKALLKNLFYHLDRFALKLGVDVRSYSALIEIKAPQKASSRSPFSDEEIKQIWAIEEQEWVDSILCFLYMGWRLNELLSIKTEDVDLQEATITGGLKTEAGKNRIVPIHSRILHLIQRRYDPQNEYLFSFKNNRCLDVTYRAFWRKIMSQLNLNHTPHDCRHTFRSNLDRAGANERCMDLLMGHKSQGTGKEVYTHKTIDELKATIELLN